MSKKLKRKKPKPPKLSREERSRGGRHNAENIQRGKEALAAIKRGEYVPAPPPDTTDRKPCPLLEKNQRAIRERLGLPEPTYVDIPPPPVDPRLLALQDMDYERRVRLLSDD